MNVGVRLVVTLALFLTVSQFFSPLAAATNSGGWTEVAMDRKALDLMLAEINESGPFTVELESTPYRSEGRLNGCGLSFSILLRDWAYRSNRPTIARGSVVYFVPVDRAPHLSMRIFLVDLERRANSVWKRVSSVHYAYLRRGQESTAQQEDANFEGEHAVRVFVYGDPEVQKLEWLLGDPPLTVNFNRQPGGTDLEFTLPIVLSDSFPDLLACLSEMVGF